MISIYIMNANQNNYALDPLFNDYHRHKAKTLYWMRLLPRKNCHWTLTHRQKLAEICRRRLRLWVDEYWSREEKVLILKFNVWYVHTF